jgi:LacI family transcriptional regulator
VSDPRRVVLLIESSRSYGRNLLTGIAAYARAFGPWTFYHEERTFGALSAATPAAIERWRPHGIIARMENDAFIRRIRRLKVPTIDLLHEEGVRGIPSVVPNQQAISRLAAEHLLECRLMHFAYCGLPGIAFSEQRCCRFVQHLAAFGHHVDIFQFHSPTPAQGLVDVEHHAMRHADELAAWLRGLPKPVGLMACSDMRAYQVLGVCREHGILVPDEVAVIGVDNDVLQCELCDPPLSSVDNSGQSVGYQAAALLDRIMQHGEAAPPMTLIEPAGVVARRSTDVLAVAGREVIEVVRYVRSHASDGLTPTILSQRTALSRSTLERWFTKHLGHSVTEEINRVKLGRVKELLVNTDLALVEIAKRAGFGYSETMQRAFKTAVGQTPGQYRSNERGNGPPPASPAKDHRRHSPLPAILRGRSGRGANSSDAV